MVSVNLYSESSKELEKFLCSFYNSSFNINNNLNWEHKYENPIEITEIIGAFVDNFEDFKIMMWVSLDNGVYIHEKESREEESDLGCRTILFITWPLFGLLARTCLNSRGERRKQRRGSCDCATEWKCQRYRERPKRRALDRCEYSCKRNNKWHRL